ncbi:hypothetical protein, partial [Sphingobacterium spiritivorum]|uniref:hypothetical protein n=1 Tax=Sphingobacterium spiritivorum TaxID=258 RepID=UPI003686CC05
SNNPYKYKIIKKKVKVGFRKIEILSVKAPVYKVKTIFLLPNQYVLIEFYTGIQNTQKKTEFDITNQFNPLYYE